MSSKIDGVYAAYLSGLAGQGFAMLLFDEQKISGADSVGVIYDGEYSETDNDSYSIKMDVKAPPNTPTIQGIMTGPRGEENHLVFDLPSDFLKRDFVRIETGNGAVNAKLVKVRDI